MLKKQFNMDIQLFAEEAGQAADVADGGDNQQAQEAKIYDENYVKQLRNESAKYRTKVKEREQAETQRMTELFKALGINPDPNKNFEKQISELQQKNQEIESRANDRLIRSEIKFISSTLGVVDPDVAFQLLDKSKVQIKEDGSISGVKEALEALLKAKPYLRGQSTQVVGGNTNPGSQSAGFSMNDFIRQSAGRK